MNTFGDVVRARRRQLGHTVTRVAAKIGSHKGYVSGIENGKTPPPHWKILKRLATFLELDLLDLAELALAEKAPVWLRDRLRKRLMADNPLYNAQIVEPEPQKPDMVIPERKETA